MIVPGIPTDLRLVKRAPGPSRTIVTLSVSCQWPASQRCSVACGTCYNIYSVFGFNTTEGVPRVAVQTEYCGQDNIGCVNTYLNAHPV